MLPHKCQKLAYIACIGTLLALLLSILFSVSMSRVWSSILIALVLICLVIMFFSEEKVEDEMIKSLRAKAIAKTAVIYFCFIVVLRIIMLFASREVRDMISDMNADAGIVILFAIHYYNSFKRSIGKREHLI